MREEDLSLQEEENPADLHLNPKTETLSPKRLKAFKKRPKEVSPCAKGRSSSCKRKEGLLLVQEEGLPLQEKEILQTYPKPQHLNCGNPTPNC